MTASAFTLRPYRASDEAAAIALWQESWQQAYPDIDFATRLTWWRARWQTELVPSAAITVAAAGDELVGFVTLNASGYLDQIVVAPRKWGADVAKALLDETKRQSAGGITLDVNTDNARAIRFYQKHGFTIISEGTNPNSGRPTYKMQWQP